MTAALFEACKRALHVVRPDGSTVRAGRATLLILELLGFRTARVLTHAPFVWMVECVYRIVASNRRFFSAFFFRAS
jgi:predicted DCC family thiol-disulfide oxidoreductase YuxK